MEDARLNIVAKSSLGLATDLQATSWSGHSRCQNKWIVPHFKIKQVNRLWHTKMNKDDLRLVWICDVCRIVLLFREDGEVHCQKTGHEHLTAYDIQTGQKLDSEKGINHSSRQSMYDTAWW